MEIGLIAIAAVAIKILYDDIKVIEKEIKRMQKRIDEREEKKKQELKRIGE